MVERVVDVDLKRRRDQGDRPIQPGVGGVATQEVADADVVVNEGHVPRCGRNVDGGEAVEIEPPGAEDVAEERLERRGMRPAHEVREPGEPAWPGRHEIAMPPESRLPDWESYRISDLKMMLRSPSRCSKPPKLPSERGTVELVESVSRGIRSPIDA